jgi:hypothetical protein
MKLPCRSCQGTVSKLVNFGDQPITNRYVSETNLREKEYLHQLSLGSCLECGLIQLIELPPHQELKPRLDWVSYIEPESHLSSLADFISKLPEINHQSTFIGITYKEDPLLQRLGTLGFQNFYRLDPQKDLFIHDKTAGLETIQAIISEQEIIPPKKADVVIARHILEHAFQISDFIAGVKHLGHDNSLVIFEIPDCSKIFAFSDYSFIWEEHTAYFTELTLTTALENNGLEVLHLIRYPYATEDSLVAITKPSDAQRGLRSSAVASQGFFSTSLEEMADKYTQVLSSYKLKGVLFGAGHLAATFVNLYKLSEYFDCIIDDDPNKIGLFMPGSKLPIHSSQILNDRKYPLCIMTLSPESEQKVMKKYSSFAENGGIFASAFCCSQYSLLKGK